jgi:hypothetical protein
VLQCLSVSLIAAKFCSMPGVFGGASERQQFVSASLVCQEQAMPESHGSGHTERLQQVVDDFEEALQKGEMPTLESYLPDEPTLRRFALLELVHAELEFRLKAGEPARVEEYLGRFPELAQDAEVMWQLIRAEYEQRRRREPALDADEYAQRFPQLCHALPTVADAPAPAGSGLPSLPGYDVLDLLGRGAMGVVYTARQRQLQRLVALKMIRGGASAGPEELARFRTEAEAIARLQHPQIVQIFEVGEYDRLPFLALEYCPGGSLEKKLAGTPLPPREAAALVEKLAWGMQAAHAKGVVHRDLKPANVLLAEDGTPKVTDFGLAKKLDEAGQTQSGAIMGTPSYMAPEQARGQGSGVGPAADTYALGAILYECLTGRPPFKAATTLETLQQVLEDEPVPPTRLNAQVPRDLETICLKCLRKEAARRYTSAEALAEDLRRYLAGEPILARPVGRVERAVKWVKRRPAVAALVGAVVLVTALGLGAFAWAFGETLQALAETEKARKQADADRRQADADRKQAQINEKKAEKEKQIADKARQQSDADRKQAEADRERADIARKQKEKQLLRAESLLYGTQIQEADQHLLNYDLVQCRLTLDACRWDLRGPEYGYLVKQLQKKARTLYGHNNAVSSLALSGDGKRLVSGSLDKTIKVWDLEAGKESSPCAGIPVG